VIGARVDPSLRMPHATDLRRWTSACPRILIAIKQPREQELLEPCNTPKEPGVKALLSAA
jgi:hypothetical protein